MTVPVLLVPGPDSGVGPPWAAAVAAPGAKVLVAAPTRARIRALSAGGALGEAAELMEDVITEEEEINIVVTAAVTLFGRLVVAITPASKGNQTHLGGDSREFLGAVRDQILWGFSRVWSEVCARGGEGSGRIVKISSTHGDKGGREVDVYVRGDLRGRGHKEGGALEGEFRDPGQRRCARSDRHRDGQPLHGHRGSQRRAGIHDPVSSAGKHRGTCQRDRVHLVPGSVLHLRHGVRCGRRHVCDLRQGHARFHGPAVSLLGR